MPCSVDLPWLHVALTCYYLTLTLACLLVRSTYPRLTLYGKVLLTATETPIAGRATSIRRDHARVGWHQTWQFMVERCTVPKHYFTHFYLNGLLIHTLVTGMAARSMTPTAHPRWYITAIVYAAHLGRRAWESSVLATYHPNARMHVMQYAVGMTYYPVTSIALTLLGWPCRGMTDHAVGSAWAWLGLAVFGWASWEQHQAHRILAHLRKRPVATATSGAASVTSSYRLPRGRYFELVSCPHYFFEWCMYAGIWFWRVGGGDGLEGTGWMLANLLWIAVGLGVSALSTHTWYEKMFPEARKILKRRKAMWPYLF